MAGVERIELPSAVLETDVLPLYDAPNKMVTSTGFEPVSAAVKGRCVKPLHQLAINGARIYYHSGYVPCNLFFQNDRVNSTIMKAGEINYEADISIP